MKTVRLLAVLALTLGLTAGCASQGVSVPDPRLDGTWHLTFATDKHGIMTLDNTDITLQIGRFTGGKSPCNGYSATVTGSVGVVYIQTSQSAGGEDCPNQRATNLDSRYLAALAASSFANVSGDTLVLTSAHTSLQYTKSPNRIPTSLLQTTWLLAQLPANASRDTSNGVYSPQVSLTFESDNRFKVHSSCANYEPSYTLVGSQIAVTDPILVHLSTAASCTASGKVLDEHLEALLFSQFSTSVSFAAGDRGTTLIIVNPAAGLSGLFVPQATLIHAAPCVACVGKATP